MTSARALAGCFFAVLVSACTTTPATSSAPGSGTTPSATPSVSASPAEVIPPQPVASSVPFPLEATIPELQKAMENGELTSLELVDFYLARIAAYDDAGPKLNAFIFVNPRARKEAAALDAERAASGPRGPLHGIPVVLKDVIDTADMPTTGGSRALEGFVPDEDAFQVRKLREAGAIILGKTNLYELANGFNSVSSLGGQTLSPYDLSRDPGGSSGGSAVAVTANFAVAGFGTDSCGSVRYPAVLNDLYGLRPTAGLSSRTGLIPLSMTLDTMAPMARSVVDLAIVLDATAGKDPQDPTTVKVDASYQDAVDPNGLSGRRIGVVSFTLDPEVDQLVSAAVDDLEANGAEIVEVAMPCCSDVGPLFYEQHAGIDEYLAARPTAPVGSMREMARLNVEDAAFTELYRGEVEVKTTDFPAHREALEGRDPFRDAIVALMDENDLDALFYPESRNPAPPIGNYQEPYDCAAAPYAGLPAISVPAGFTSDGLPVGFELMGRPFAEPTLIAMASGYEAHTDHRILPPTTPPL
jgi:Asp-tRNA(Asn)/Glu-tRNA(Gln) amidotransferase A subunit family amidase